jgi:putative NADH-flavin reductase
MQIALFGVTGGTGRQVLEQALAAGHRVTALVRDPTKLGQANGGLTVIEGNVLNRSDVARTVAGSDAVICALGNTRNNPATVVSTGTQNIVEAMRQHNVRRLIVVTSLGVGDSKEQVPFFFKVLSWTVLRNAMREKAAQEAIVRASGLDWTIVRPGGLTDGPRTGRYRAGLDPKIKAGQIARADVAAFLLQQLTDQTFLHQTPAIT